MTFVPSTRSLSPSEMVIHRLYEITSDYEAGFDRQLNQLLQLGLDRFELDIGIVARVEGDSYEVVEAVTPPGVQLGQGDTFPLGNTYCSITLDADGPVGFEAAGASPHAGHPAYGMFKLESYIGVPVRHGSDIYGTLNFSSANVRERTFDEVDLDCLRLMGSWMSTEIRRRDLERELTDARHHLEHLVRTDHLTELANRRGLEDRLQRLARRSTLSGEPLSCVLVDIDDFKAVNDHFGHSAGDRVIRAVADQIRACLRPMDMAARVGGDEFMAILTAAQAEAAAVARRIGSAVQRLQLKEGSSSVPISVSIGVAEIGSEVRTVTDALSRAQSFLRDSKLAGKNTVTSALA